MNVIENRIKQFLQNTATISSQYLKLKILFLHPHLYISNYHYFLNLLIFGWLVEEFRKPELTVKEHFCITGL